MDDPAFPQALVWVFIVVLLVLLVLRVFRFSPAENGKVKITWISKHETCAVTQGVHDYVKLNTSAHIPK